MQISVCLAATPLVLLLAMQHADATSILNCSGATVRIVPHHRDTVPSKRGTILQSGKSHKVLISGPDTIVKIFEVRLFDVLRISASHLAVDATYSVATSADGRWALEHRERC